MSTRDIEAALRKRFPSDAYALIFQVPNGTGSHKTRTADALAFGLWPSRGLDVEGIEVKASRSDWRREIEKPHKAAAFSRHCHRWWIATVPGVVETGELPAEWGLLELKRGVLRQTVEAPRTAEPEPIPFKMWLGIMRAVQNNELAAVHAERRSITETANREAEQRHAHRVEALTATVEKFKESTGVDIRYQWNPDEIGQAMELVRQGRDYRNVLQSVNGLAGQLRRVADQLDAAASGEVTE